MQFITTLSVYAVILQSRPITRSSDSNLGSVVFLIFVGLALLAIAAFTVGAIIYSSNKRTDRAAKLKAIAGQLGFSYVPKPGVPDFLKNTRFAQWYPAVGTGIHNLLSGNVNGMTVFIFDFGYTTAIGGFGSATYYEAVACIPHVGELFTFCSNATLIAPEQIRAFLDAAMKAFDQTPAAVTASAI